MLADLNPLPPDYMRRMHRAGVRRSLRMLGRAALLLAGTSAAACAAVIALGWLSRIG